MAALSIGLSTHIPRQRTLLETAYVNRRCPHLNRDRRSLLTDDLPGLYCSQFISLIDQLIGVASPWCPGCAQAGAAAILVAKGARSHVDEGRNRSRLAGVPPAMLAFGNVSIMEMSR